MKAEILLQEMISQGDIQAVDEKAQTYRKERDDLDTFINIALWQVIWTHCGIFTMSTYY